MEQTKLRPNPEIFGVPRREPGWIYLVQHNELFKIGKTSDPNRRLQRDAKTWLPDLQIIGAKPFWNVSFVERSLHVGLARNWYAGEWYRFDDPPDVEFFVEGFLEFYDDDRDWKSVDFIYWMNSSGMAEFCHELVEQRLTLPAFQRQESDCRKQQ